MGPFDVTGKRAIVTGGAMGIGFGIAKRFVEGGAHALLVDLDEKAVFEAAKKLGSKKQVQAIALDVADDAAGDQMVARCVEAFGGVDILVNNAGIYPQVPMLEMAPELFDKVYRINLRGLAFASKAAAQQMIKQGGGGKIVNIASIDAIHPSMVGLAAYDASKGGVVMFTKNFALELGPHNINVNAIAPGAISTEGTRAPLEGSGMSEQELQAIMDAWVERLPIKRLGEPDDIATTAVFLASDAASYMTGSVVVVDGGSLLA